MIVTMEKINIAIDGYSSCGKSTLAKALAKSLSYHYIDTGSMYRALALYAIQNDFLKENGEVDIDLFEKTLPTINVEFKINPENNRSEVYLNKVSVEHLIRTVEIAGYASKISQYRSVRNKLHHIQKAMALKKGVIMDGRDIGTVVIPDAELKIFMTADPEVRAKRRFVELQALGKNTTLEEVKLTQAKRDQDDTEREEDPLRKADDAVVLDNTFLSEHEQLDFVLQLANQKVMELS